MKGQFKHSGKLVASKGQSLPWHSSLWRIPQYKILLSYLIAAGFCEKPAFQLHPRLKRVKTGCRQEFFLLHKKPGLHIQVDGWGRPRTPSHITCEITVTLNNQVDIFKARRKQQECFNLFTKPWTQPLFLCFHWVETHRHLDELKLVFILRASAILVQR